MDIFTKARNTNTAAIAVVVLSLFLHSAAQIRIMPLGDSRTAGPSSRDCYRLYLDRLMTAAGYSFDLVGTVTGHNYTLKPPDSVFDADHQGMWGWTMAQMLQKSPGLGDWVRSRQPDIVLAMLGTTDILGGDSIHVKLPATLERIEAFIDTLRAVNPKVAILLSNLYPAYPPYFSNWHHLDSLRRRIPELVDSVSTAESPVFLIDTWTGFSPTRDLVDGLHSNQGGSTRIAQKFLDVLWPYFDTIPPPTALRPRPARLVPDRGDPFARRAIMPLDMRHEFVFTVTGRRTLLPEGSGSGPALVPVIAAPAQSPGAHRP